MDFLNKAFAQFSDLFRSMTPGGRITAGLLLVVAVVSVGYLFQSQVSGGDEYLFSGDSIPTPTLQKMEAAFGKAGLNGFTIEGGRVKVPRAQRALYLAALADAKALPPNFGQSQKDSTDGGIFDPPSVHAEKYKISKQEDLALVISSMKGIERASVIIDTQPQSGGIGLPPLKTASVAVQAIGGVSLDDEQVDTIRYYVAAAIGGMKPENVTIADVNGRVHPGTEAGSGPDGDPYARRVRAYEQETTLKIRNALAYIPNVTVALAATLDHEKGSRSVKIERDPKPVPIRTSEATSTSNRESGSTGGAPGFEANGGGAMKGATLGASGGKGNETSEESRSETVNEVTTTSTEKETAGYTPKSAKVSIGIPASYYEKVWKEQNPPEEGKEAKKPDQTALKDIADKITQDVRTTVATLLPTAADVKDPTALVTVTTFQDIKTAAIQGPPVTQRALSWLGQNWPMIAMIGLVLFSVGVLRSTLRSVPASSAQSAAVSMRVTGDEPKSEEQTAVEATAARRLRRMSGSGPSLRDELSELVKEDPDSAANVLRSWIGQVT
jgi:flagellar M-ring protein FliF